MPAVLFNGGGGFRKKRIWKRRKKRDCLAYSLREGRDGVFPNKVPGALRKGGRGDLREERYLAEEKGGGEGLMSSLG